jgi:uncharacterized membrane protein HdeD (DUF308 family)
MATVLGGRESSATTRGDGIGGLAVVMGLLMIILGIMCMIVPKAFGVAAVVYLGVLLGLSGLVEVIAGVRDRQEHRALLMAGGLLSLAVGVVMVVQPQLGLAAFRLLVAGFLLATGLHAALTAFFGQYPRKGWDLAFGVVAILLGIIAVAWPTVALWMIGTLVGIEVVVRGATLVAMGLRLDAHTPLPRVA